MPIRPDQPNQPSIPDIKHSRFGFLEIDGEPYEPTDEEIAAEKLKEDLNTQIAAVFHALKECQAILDHSKHFDLDEVETAAVTSAIETQSKLDKILKHLTKLGVQITRPSLLELDLTDEQEKIKDDLPERVRLVGQSLTLIETKLINILTPEQLKILEGKLIFTVPDAINPYASWLRDAGVTDPTVLAERKEMTMDIFKIAQECAERYREQGLTQWADDIKNNLQTLLDAVVKPEERQKIVSRIKAGMVPVAMPSRQVQLANWQTNLRLLKPVWIVSGQVQRQETVFIDEPYFSQKMKIGTPRDKGFFDNIPDRPYLHWDKPTQEADRNTCNRSFAEQQAYYTQSVIVSQTPDENNLAIHLSSTDTIPTEYAALQSIFTDQIDKLSSNNRGRSISPLDKAGAVTFLFAGVVSDGGVLSARFSPEYRQVLFAGDRSVAISRCGFRPSARS